MSRFKFVVLVIAALAFAASVPVLADAKPKAKHHKKKQHSGNVVTQIVAISSTGAPPVSGTAIQAGIVNGALGSGAVRATTTFTAPTFTSSFRVFYNGGSISGNLTGTGKPAPDGSITASGTGSFSGGTGIYKGATGSFTFTATQPAKSNVTTFNTKGHVDY